MIYDVDAKAENPFSGLLTSSRGAGSVSLSEQLAMHNSVVGSVSYVAELQDLHNTAARFPRWTSKDKVQKAIDDLVLGMRHVGSAAVWKENWWSKWSIKEWKSRELLAAQL